MIDLLCGHSAAAAESQRQLCFCLELEGTRKNTLCSDSFRLAETSGADCWRPSAQRVCHACKGAARDGFQLRQRRCTGQQAAQLQADSSAQHARHSVQRRSTQLHQGKVLAHPTPYANVIQVPPGSHGCMSALASSTAKAERQDFG